jgi:hypothetical protein
LIYLRALYYFPAKGIFTSLDPFEGIPDSPMSLNGYSYVEGNPVNRRDPSGECPQNPHPFDVFGWRCRFLAEGLAARIGVPAENYMWMDYGQLESLTALGSLANVSAAANQTLDNASIIPMLFLQNPQLTLKALELFGCQNQGTPLGFASMLYLPRFSGGKSKRQVH